MMLQKELMMIKSEKQDVREQIEDQYKEKLSQETVTSFWILHSDAFFEPQMKPGVRWITIKVDKFKSKWTKIFSFVLTF